MDVETKEDDGDKGKSIVLSKDQPKKVNGRVGFKIPTSVAETATAITVVKKANEATGKKSREITAITTGKKTKEDVAAGKKKGASAELKVKHKVEKITSKKSEKQ